MSTFVLVPSPLTGPLIWQGVEETLRRRQHRVVVPDLRGAGLDTPCYWRQHVAQAVAALSGVPVASPLILVGHSGAGVLLPLIAASGGYPVAAFIFVDSDLPEDGKSRLELFAEATTPGAAADFRQTARDGFLPVWTEDDLRAEIPQAALRARFVADLHPLPLAAYEEPVPEPAEWDEAPCAYLRFSPSYQAPAAVAREAGWEYAELPGSHFMLLTDPGPVALSIVLLCARLGVDLSRQ